MIGYYVHHQGRGHLHRARVLAEHLGSGAGPEAVTGLSSLERPDGWRGDWVTLPLDVDPDVVDGEPAVDPTAGGVLHWAPLGHSGLRARSAAVSAWLHAAAPRLVVSDVSQEVTLLCRLHGVPVVSTVLPGVRDDPAHRTGLAASEARVVFWPPDAGAMLPGLPDDLAEVHAVGGLSRFTPPARRDPRPERSDGRRRLVVLGGSGGDAWTVGQVDALRDAVPAWEVTVLGPGGDWVADPWPVLLDADVAVVHAGQNAVAEVAAARLPAVVVPATRPFDEQVTTARVLDTGRWPAVALARLAHDDWPGLLDRVAALDGGLWQGWCDGGAAGRFAAVVRGVAPAHASAPGAVT